MPPEGQEVPCMSSQNSDANRPFQTFPTTFHKTRLPKRGFCTRGTPFSNSHIRMTIKSSLSAAFGASSITAESWSQVFEGYHSLATATQNLFKAPWPQKIMSVQGSLSMKHVPTCYRKLCKSQTPEHFVQLASAFRQGRRRGTLQ